MEPVEFIAVKEEDNIDDLKIESNYFPFDLFEVEERKQELTDALKYCIDLLKDAQIILDLQNSNRTISKRSQLMGKEIQHRIMDMLDSMKFMDEEDEKMECQEDPMSFSLENSCDLNGKGLINDNIKSVEKVASLLNQSIECIDEDKSIILNNYENSVNSGSIKTVTSNEVFNEQQEKLLEEYLIHCSDIYFGTTTKDACSLAYQLASKLQIEMPENWKKDELARRKWFYGFMQRHPNLTLENPEATSLVKMDFLPSSITDQPIEHCEESSTENVIEKMKQRFDKFINRPLSISTSRTSEASLNETLQSIRLFPKVFPRKNMGRRPMKINILTNDTVMHGTALKQETRQMHQIEKATQIDVRINAEELNKTDSSKRKKQDTDFVTVKP